MIDDSRKIKSLMYGLKIGLKIDLIYLKGLTMENEDLKKISDFIRKEWENNILDVSEVEEYAKLYGYCFSSAKEFKFCEYLENFSERGKTTYRWYGLVDDAACRSGFNMDDLTELDYQIVWGYINGDIDKALDKNVSIDRPVLAMIKK